MKYQSGAAFRQALEQRLLTRSRDRAFPLSAYERPSSLTVSSCVLRSPRQTAGF